MSLILLNFIDNPMIKKPHDKELPSKDEIIGLASIAMPPSDPLEQYLLDHENGMFMNERRDVSAYSAP